MLGNNPEHQWGYSEDTNTSLCPLPREKSLHNLLAPPFSPLSVLLSPQVHQENSMVHFGQPNVGSTLRTEVRLYW